ncbi:transcriptional regulator [Streptococcus troglodytae]|uniref:Transcriptional regulator n=1 Tax=Streptococcus troglodytae TaxID=1111760 RepID=A0A1L7LLI5_9STRE|nr:transcriptional regulator [Streptococcus troglodytae]
MIISKINYCIKWIIRLYDIEEWSTYEVYIFGNIMTALSSENLIFLGKAFVERDKLYRSIPSHKTVIITAPSESCS